MKTTQILHGNNKELLKNIATNSIDSIVTDPPYELGFMGKKWDNTGIAYDVELWKECLRVLKPGGHLLAFSGTRTYHRMAVAIEDAEFEIRDMIEWVYGSGFPKSHNIRKAVDKLLGNERELVGKKPTGADTPTGKGTMQLSKKTFIDLDGKRVFNLTKGTSEHEGWGTALKPAHEPICMARKPLSEKSVAENALKWKTGGINIDACRVENTKEQKELDIKRAGYKDGVNHIMKTNKDLVFNVSFYPPKDHTSLEHINIGRFPANLIHDGSDEVKACFPETKSGSGVKNPKGGAKSTFRTSVQDDGYYSEGDSGKASRFFKSIIYQSKASPSERGGVNNHPTVKPVALIAYLLRLVTPVNGISLDPFAGSGTHAEACIKEGFQFIAMEQEAEYIEIIKHRVAKALSDIEVAHK
jgi:DNA modification methylase